MSVLGDVLTAVRAARSGSTLDDVAEQLGLTRDDVAAMVDYWVRRGELTIDEVGGCPPVGCAGCHFGRPGVGSCGRVESRARAGLIAITAPQVTRRPGTSAARPKN
jgi:hypothetical protein